MFMVYETAELAILAQTYCGLQQVSLASLGETIFKNHKFFKLLVAGKPALSHHTEKASKWFDENWPADAPWPQGIERSASQSEAA